MVFYTSITTNYLPKARVLADSVRKHCPGSLFYVMLSDVLPPDFDLTRESFDSVLYIEDLALPVENLSAWVFQHTVVELCTAVKGQALVYLLEKHPDQNVVYLDPDIVVMNPLTELEEMLQRHPVVLTPHQCHPSRSRDDLAMYEAGLFKFGVYNLGFLAIANNPEGREVACWWRDMLIDHCYDSVEEGLFTDQKIMDMAPSFFSQVHILRDPSYNVCFWNIRQRELSGPLNALQVNGVPLKFYHFSNVDGGTHRERLLLHLGRDHVALRLLQWYIDQQQSHGWEQLHGVVYRYATYSNAEKIPALHRKIYRTRPDVQQRFRGQDPAIVTKEDCFYTWVHREEDKYSSPERAELERIYSSRSWKLVLALRKILGRA